MIRNTCLLLGIVLMIIIPLIDSSSEEIQLISFDRDEGRLRFKQFSLLRSFPAVTRKYKQYPTYGDSQFLIKFDKILELTMCIVIASIF